MTPNPKDTMSIEIKTAEAVRIAQLELRIERALAICKDAEDMGCACIQYQRHYGCNDCPDRIAERAGDAVEVLRGDMDHIVP